MRALLLTLALTSACSTETIRVHLTQGDSMDDHELVEAAAAQLGLGVEFVSYKYGAVQLELRDYCWVNRKHGYVCGLSRYGAIGACHGREGRMIRRVGTVTHELGHILGLDHHSDPLNVMYPDADSLDREDLEPEQQRVVWRQAAMLNACAP